MSTSSSPRVTDARGTTGRLDLDASGAEDVARVRLSDGSAVQVPRHLLEQQADGSYRLDASFESLTATEDAARSVSAESARVGGAKAVGDTETVEEEVTVPLVEEEVSVRKEERETGRVRIRKQVREYTETVDEPLLREEVEVERVPINTVIAEPATIRERGDTTIIPIMEERVVVEKQLVLVEELHVRRTRTEHRDPQEVTLRREEANVERTDLRSGEPRQAGPQGGDATEHGAS